MKILFASSHNLLDRSSGAAISVKTLLDTLAKAGHEAAAYTSLVTDSQASFNTISKDFEESNKLRLLKFLINGVTHHIFTNHSWFRPLMTAHEQELFEINYQKLLDTLQPDVVITYGGMLLERSFLSEARRRGIKTVFYLANPNYPSKLFFRDADLVITDTQSTADYYHDRFQLKLHPLGKFIDRNDFTAAIKHPKYVTFINPSFEKGVGLFARLALLCKEKAPEIEFLVVESRSQLKSALPTLGLTMDQLTNVKLVPFQADMKSVFSVSKVLLIPSFWKESGPRLAIEAALNNIPMIASSHIGVANILSDAARLIELPQAVLDKHTQLVDEDTAKPWLEELQKLMFDEEYYKVRSRKMGTVGNSYDCHAAIGKFVSLLESLS